MLPPPIKPRSLMMYGISGSTKTSQAYHLASKILAENPGKRFRMIYSDGGGWFPFEESGMIERGEVEVYDFGASKYPFDDYRRLSDGYWPRMDNSGKMQFKKSPEFKTTDEQWKDIIGYIIEGMGSTAEVIKAFISNQTEGFGFKESWKYVSEDGDTVLGLQTGHYGIVQREMHERHVTGFNCLPIKWLIYTSLLGKGEDKKNGNETVYGPQVAGNASTPMVPSWFMDCLHLSKERYRTEEIVDGVKTEKEVEGMVAWFQRHEDNNGTPCLAKARCMPEKYPELLKWFPHGFVPLSHNAGIKNYYKVLDHISKRKG